MSKENRAHDRHSARWQIQLAIPGSHFFHKGLIYDASIKGLSFHCETAIPPETKAQILLLLPPCDARQKFDEVKLLGRIAYSVLQGELGFRTGVEFIGLSDKDEDHIKKRLMASPIVFKSDTPEKD